jgi:hypothetical protein
LVPPVFSLTLRSGASVDVLADEVIDDDLIAFGRQVNIKGKVNGDLFAFAQQVYVSGEVGGTIVSAGSLVDISAKTSRSVWAAGGNVQLSGTVVNNALLCGGTLNADKANQVGKDLIAFGGQFNLAGSVGRQVRGSVGVLTMSGKAGRVDIASDKTNIGAQAEIGGDLVIRGEKPPVIEAGAKIAGEKRYTPEGKAKRSRGARISVFTILMFLASLLVGFILIAGSSRFTRRVVDTLYRQPWRSLGIGFAILVAGPVAIVILLVIMVGIPLSVFGFFTYVVLLYLSSIFIGLAVGEKIIRLFKKEGDISQYASLALGTSVLFLVGLVPWIGFAVKLLIVVFGMGALAVGITGLLKETRTGGLL